jgi:hypothetical protein
MFSFLKRSRKSSADHKLHLRKPWLRYPNMTGRLRLLIVCAIPIFLGAAGGLRAKEYSSEAGRFSIRFPGSPSVEKTDKGRVTTETAVCKGGAADGLTFVAMFNREPTPPGQASAFFEGFRNGLLRKLKGKLVRETVISLGDMPGRELLVADVLGKVMRCRVYSAGDCSYTLMVLGTDERAVHSGEAETFMSSFRITQPPAAAQGNDQGPGLAFAVGERIGRYVTIAALVFLVVSLLAWGRRSPRRRSP